MSDFWHLNEEKVGTILRKIECHFQLIFEPGLDDVRSTIFM